MHPQSYTFEFPIKFTTLPLLVFLTLLLSSCGGDQNFSNPATPSESIVLPPPSASEEVQASTETTLNQTPTNPPVINPTPQNPAPSTQSTPSPSPEPTPTPLPSSMIPSLRSVYPNTVVFVGRRKIRLTGANLRNVERVMLGDSECVNLRIISNSSIECLAQNLTQIHFNIYLYVEGNRFSFSNLLSVNGVGANFTSKRFEIGPSSEYYLIGESENLVSNRSQMDWFLDELVIGTSLHRFSFDGNQNVDRADDIRIDPQMENLYIAASGINLVGANTRSDWWITKFDIDHLGAHLPNWNKRINFDNYEDYAFAIDFDQNGNVFFGGANNYQTQRFTSSPGFNWDIRKYSPQGTEITDSRMGFDGQRGAGNDWLRSIYFDPNTQMLYGFGNSARMISSQSQFDVTINRFLPNNLLDSRFTHSYDFSNRSERVKGAARDAAGNFYVVGNSEGNSDWQGFIIKFLPSGEIAGGSWPKLVGGSNTGESFESIAIASDGKIYVGGYQVVSGNPKALRLIYLPNGNLYKQDHFDPYLINIKQIKVDSNNHIHYLFDEKGLDDDVLYRIIKENAL